MKTAFLSFEDHLGKKDIGSSRIRAKWVVDNWCSSGEDIGTAEMFKQGGDYNVVVFQKAYFLEYAKSFKGIKILDLCDPDWLIWAYPIKEMIEYCDAVTCSSMEIAKFIITITDKKVVYIPDRIDLSLLPKPKKHFGQLKTVAWYGYAHNFPMLEASMPALKKRGLELIVISNQVFTPPTSLKEVPLKNFPWSEHYLNDLQKADVVINPQIMKGKWKYKSNNKTTLPWALGLPVAHTDIELDNFAGEKERQEESEKRLKEIKENYDIHQSVRELKELIKEIGDEKGHTT